MCHASRQTDSTCGRQGPLDQGGAWSKLYLNLIVVVLCTRQRGLPACAGVAVLRRVRSVYFIVSAILHRRAALCGTVPRLQVCSTRAVLWFLCVVRAAAVCYLPCACRRTRPSSRSSASTARRSGPSSLTICLAASASSVVNGAEARVCASFQI